MSFLTEYREPESLEEMDVCPHCKVETQVFLVSCEGHVFETHRCVDHGDVQPMRSAVFNSPMKVAHG